ncbi:PR5-like receptor kinase [Humulus lupulus]|uniref:PR5-like receptor kinase n=1 Tax=Humulus lupulus TaxID=3486 RepID=UPI002B404AFB|nr:PR5-like receptor kinase [Humulus lupulus]
MRSAIKATRIWRILRKKDQSLEAFIRNYAHLNEKRYKFKDVKKMTKSFKEKLGQGGYGEVYKGKLREGRVVAVKLLNASRGDGQEFVNEVESIGRTSHVNIVALWGFCLEGSKRALIYEFMPNGSLEKFIDNENHSQFTQRLEWKKLLQIAIEIARELEYLHRGCNTRILHLDIKPHNILLDEDLSPKISDFGLAKLCPKKESVISLLDARGTIGYIAPEVYSRNFGGVSSKSDVYSYGMMMLEMVGGRRNIKIGGSQKSEIYFPDWIYKHLEQGSNLEIWGEMTSNESEIARKMVNVSLWCIQTSPIERPSMSKVIEMLEGSLRALQLPPMPSMFAPVITPERLPAEILIESSKKTSL